MVERFAPTAAWSGATEHDVPMDAPSGRTPKEDLLIGGLDDWADAGWASMSTGLSGQTNPATLREKTLDLLAEVLRGGLMVAGDIAAGTFVAWGGSTEDAVQRIRHEWIDGYGDVIPAPGAIVWLSNTAAGDELARAALKRETEG